MTLFIGLVVPAAVRGASQQATGNSEPLQAILVQMQEMRTALNDMRDQLASSRRESQALRQELDSLRDQLKADRNGADPVSTLAESEQVLEAKVEDQHQTKVESGSKYRVRLSGLALTSVFSNRGTFDNIDLPGFATSRLPGAKNGSFGASARQSQIEASVFGPEWKGAVGSSRVDLQACKLEYSIVSPK